MSRTTTKRKQPLVEPPFGNGPFCVECKRLDRDGRKMICGYHGRNFIDAKSERSNMGHCGPAGRFWVAK